MKTLSNTLLADDQEQDVRCEGARPDAFSAAVPSSGRDYSLPGRAILKCQHARTSTGSEPVVIQVGNPHEIGSRQLVYQRHFEYCLDCGDTLVIPTPGLVVNELLAVITDEGQQSSNAWALERHMEGGLGRLEAAVEKIAAGVK